MKALTSLDHLFDSKFILPSVRNMSYMWDRKVLVLEIEIIYLDSYVGRFVRFCLKFIVLPPAYWKKAPERLWTTHLRFRISK